MTAAFSELLAWVTGGSALAALGKVLLAQEVFLIEVQAIAAL